jgi:hypothetical protein
VLGWGVIHTKFHNIGSGIQKLVRGKHMQTHKHTWSKVVSKRYLFLSLLSLLSLYLYPSLSSWLCIPPNFCYYFHICALRFLVVGLWYHNTMRVSPYHCSRSSVFHPPTISFSVWSTFYQKKEVTISSRTVQNEESGIQIYSWSNYCFENHTTFVYMMFVG